jgi:hypothetical protein
MGKPRFVLEDVVLPLAWTLFLLAYFYGWGALLTRLRCFRTDGLDPVLRIALGFCAAIPAILAFGFAGILRPAVFLPFAALVAIVGVCARPPWRERWSSFLGWSALEALPATALLLALAMLAVVSLVPDFGWDALLYHLAVGKIYLREHAIVALPWLFQANFPANGDLVYLHGLMAGGGRTAMALDFLFALLAVLATYRLARCFLPRPSSALAALALVVSTDFLAVFGTSGVELCWTAFGVLALTCALVWREGPRALDGRLHLSAVLAGFVAGTKVTGVGTAAAIALVPLLSAPLGARLRTAFRFAWVSVLAASPCYLKTWIHTGTPVWPLSFGVFHPHPWDPTAQHVLETTVREQWAPFSGLSWRTIPAAVVDFASRRDGFVLGLLLLFLAGSLIQRKKLAATWPLAVFAAVHLLMWCFVTQQPRFLLPAMPAVLVGLFAMTRPVESESERPLARVLSGSAFAALWLAIFAAWAPYWPSKVRLGLQPGIPILLGQLSHEQALDRVPFRAESRRANELTPRDARILLYGESRGYFLDREYGIGDPATQAWLDYRALPDAKALAARLSELGVTHVLVGDRPERDLRQRRSAAYDFRTETMVRDVLVQCRRTGIGPLHALYDLRSPSADDRPVLVASSTDAIDRRAAGLLPDAPGPSESEPSNGWRSARVPDPNDPEEIQILYPRARSFHRLRLESPPSSAGTPTDLELQADAGGTWTSLHGASSSSADPDGRWTLEFDPIETRRLRLVLRKTRGGKAEISKLELD